MYNHHHNHAFQNHCIAHTDFGIQCFDTDDWDTEWAAHWYAW